MGNEIIEIINALSEKIGVVVDWSAENIVPQIEHLINQYARYLFLNSIVWLSVGVLVCIGMIFGFKYAAVCCKKIQNSRNNDDEELYTIIFIILIILSIIAAIVGITLILINLHVLIKTITIPEIYATQKLLALLK